MGPLKKLGLEIYFDIDFDKFQAIKTYIWWNKGECPDDEKYNVNYWKPG